jgi:DNA-binding MarR family transcriptional regulator
MNDKVNNKITDIMFKVFRNVKHNIYLDSHKTHLTPAQFEALIFIKKNKEANMGDIADCFSTTMPTATSLIDKLILAKYVVRQSDPTDRRIVRIMITKNGEDALSETLLHKEKVMNKILSFLSPNDKLELLRIMQKIADKSNEKNI